MTALKAVRDGTAFRAVKFKVIYMHQDQVDIYALRSRFYSQILFIKLNGISRIT